jgi:hypothetical protein
VHCSPFYCDIFIRNAPLLPSYSSFYLKLLHGLVGLTCFNIHDLSNISSYCMD